MRKLLLLVVTALAVTTWLSAPAQAATDPVNLAAKSLLGYQHVGQDTNYWCGPASAYILIKGMKHYGKIRTTTSSLAGSALTQSRLAGPSYLDANDGNGTQGGDLARGINKCGSATTGTTSWPSPLPLRPSQPADRLVTELFATMPS
ncbi:hypothetical protein [Tenggerimyces flavus]|uniref:Peptidase C39-like domain-containing protein n=1 Tax=Tenggerimyces flavus TaxID=1708749 RepID=A0ABV7YMQ9_9ACTN|nr:hypothetical protein [Tenggerimyces flavus]MBM7789698.1 hypothetical protein [Tenggerimyces flavus]